MKLIKFFSGITAEKHLKDRIYLLRVLFITVDANETNLSVSADMVAWRRLL